MSIEVRFTEIEDELMGVVDDCISKVLKGKNIIKMMQKIFVKN